eukprot:gene14088-21491_t
MPMPPRGNLQTDSIIMGAGRTDTALEQGTALVLRLKVLLDLGRANIVERSGDDVSS